MKIPRSDERGAAGMNMTPMIDVVFLLLIFFLVSNHLVRYEEHLALELPQAASGEPTSREGTQYVVLNLSPDGSMLLAGRRVEIEELQARLVQTLAHQGRDLELRLRSDRSVPYARIEPVLRACAGAGLWNVTIAVYRPET